jgi:hypothetical protein
MHEAIPPVPEGLTNGYLAFQAMHWRPRPKGVRDRWSKIHVTLSTIKSEFKRTFSEDVKSRHSDLKKKPKPHPSSSRSGESNLLEIREGWKPGLFLIMMHITGTEYPMQIEHCVELWFGADMLNHCTVATAGDVAHIKLAALF